MGGVTKQPISGKCDGAAGTERLRLNRVRHVHGAPPTPYDGFNLFCAIPSSKNNPAHAVMGQSIQHPRKEGTAGHWSERFGDITHDCPQARTETANQDDRFFSLLHADTSPLQSTRTADAR